jgi:hypothetical protein
MALSNVHRQNEQSYIDPSPSTLELPSFNWIVHNSIFAVPASRVSVYYSVCLVVDLELTNADIGIALASWVDRLARLAKSAIRGGNGLTVLTDVVQWIRKDVNLLARVGIPENVPFALSPWESEDFARVLTAHLSRQMCTVIESPSEERATRLGFFLAHFTLPRELRLSTLDVLAEPSPHLYIQCVAPPELGIADLMLRIAHPVSWVRLPATEDGPIVIWRSSASEAEQRKCREEFAEARFVRKCEDERTFARIRDGLQVTDRVAPAPWVLGRITVALGLAEEVRAFFCREHFQGLVRAAITLVAIVQAKGDVSMKELQTALRVTGPADLELMVAVARFLDRDITDRMAPVKRLVRELRDRRDR